MYNDKLKETILDNLGNKTIVVANTAVVLASQGYFINRNKYTKLNWSSILIHAFENIDVLNKDQQHELELIYNKVSTL